MEHQKINNPSKNSKHQLVMTITGPSGAGKDAVMSKLVERDDRIVFFATATTRKPRAGEVHGEDYFFLSKEDFQSKIKTGEILEYNEIFGRFYGTLKSVIDDRISKGYDVISDLNSDGMFQIKEKLPSQHLSFLILPPSLQVLEDRIAKRKIKTNEDLGYINQRFAKIREDLQHLHDNPDDKMYEFKCDDVKNSAINDYDYVIYNDNLDNTVKELLKIIQKERQKRQCCGENIRK